MQSAVQAAVASAELDRSFALHAHRTAHDAGNARLSKPIAFARTILSLSSLILMLLLSVHPAGAQSTAPIDSLGCLLHVRFFARRWSGWSNPSKDHLSTSGGLRDPGTCS